MKWSLVGIFLGIFFSFAESAWAAEDLLRLATFEVDASPPVGSPLAYDPTVGVQMPLSCRGLILLGAGDPIVLCAIDWIGVGNDGNRYFREQLAQAAGTSVERVTVHALHQHDAPRCDFSAEVLLQQAGMPMGPFDPGFARSVIYKTAAAVKQAIPQAQEVTHVGSGEGKVEKVASNRRILGPDGKVKHVRYTAVKDPVIRAFPAGTIDPYLKMIVFYQEETPVVALSYYATHPQSYYRTGLANPDFPGMARNARETETGVRHIHFNGAGGNIGAGKWNDGAPENRQVLADRVAAGMKLAWENVKKQPLTAEDVEWQVVPTILPVAKHLDAEKLTQIIEDKEAKEADRFYAATNLAWLRRCEAGDPVEISCLSLKQNRILHLPGELFVEYQLAAQQIRPDLFVAMAAYGDYAPGYIGTKVAYSQGGYETSERASKVAPEIEQVLMKAISQLLKVE